MKLKSLITFSLLLSLVVFSAIGCQSNQTPQTPENPTPPTNPPNQEEEPENEAEGSFENGTHTAEGEADERGWTPTIEITVDDGRITEVVYDEENEEGALKSEDEAYNERWQEGSGISAPEAYEALQNSLIETQDPEAVEAVSGATSSHEKFVTLAKEALNQ